MSNLKVLFVDDNELNRIVMQDMLEILFEDFTVEIYESAQEVLDLNTDEYDLILSDIDMPHISGFDLYTMLREDKKYTKPIIAVTALAVSGDKERMLMHGFNDYISKPVDIDILEKTIQKYC
ncbi:response regulator [Sulfurimonas sp. SAG-AH-194-I05]|nr:response regulator [Sulfurimonas sp. SAG-AH-194-I05]MDF1875384.1 response regulator [Sulfurimonas sp. SAG-AH-194-I05]